MDVGLCHCKAQETSHPMGEQPCWVFNEDGEQIGFVGPKGDPGEPVSVSAGAGIMISGTPATGITVTATENKCNQWAGNGTCVLLPKHRGDHRSPSGMSSLSSTYYNQCQIRNECVLDNGHINVCVRLDGTEAKW